jgi:predicted molibdopterin-dependent oxidoreductase YjgC
LPVSTAVRWSDDERDQAIELWVDGVPIEAYEGEMLAAALMAAGIWRLRDSPRAGTARGAFCLMGVCQECVVRVNGRLVQSCRTKVTRRMNVSTQEAQ